MFRITGTWLRAAAAARRASSSSGGRRSIARLQHDLRYLKRSNQVAEAHLRERRRLAMLHQRRQHDERSQGTSGANDDTGHSTAGQASSLPYLPRNPELETAIAFALRENRDARTELEFTRQLLSSTLLSLASPCAPRWDPYDVKPQVFALDNYLALPVFTSVEYMQAFCERFGFTVRDPSGILWAGGGGRGDNSHHEEAQKRLTAPGNIVESEWWAKAQHQATSSSSSPSSSSHTQENKSDSNEGTTTTTAAAAEAEQWGPTADDLFSALDDNNDAAPLETLEAPRLKKKKAHSKSSGRGKKRRESVRRRRSTVKQAEHHHNHAAGAGAGASSMGDTAAAGQDTSTDEKEAFWQSVASVSPFDLKQATPLPTFGPFVLPFFPGYFADMNTLLHNASIVPNTFDIVLNPCSPIEFVLSREATDRVLHRDKQLLLLAYQRVEKELQREFSVFFSEHCPEVRAARIACVPRPLDDGDHKAQRRGSRGGGRNVLQEMRAQTRLQRETEFSNGVAYEIVLLLDSESLTDTYQRIQWGKRTCRLMGHADLDILPEAAAAPHVREFAHVFYLRRDDASCANGNNAAAGGGDHDNNNREEGLLRGCFKKIGVSQTVNVAQPADSYFHDPTNAYTEAHAVFTEELKVKRS